MNVRDVGTGLPLTGNYWNMMKHLNDNTKLELIVLLTESLKNKAVPKVSAHDFYGIWGDDGMTADEFVAELKSARRFKQRTLEI